MDAASEPLAPPRLVLRVGALGNRKFGTENGIDEPPAEGFEQAARAACSDVMREIATAVVGIFVEDMGQVLPPMEHPRRFWWETRLGLLFGRADVWQRRAGAGKPAPAFRDESPLVTVLAGREPGGDTFVTQAALAMNPATKPPAGSSERYVEFESVAVIVEDPDAPPSSRPVEDPRTLSVGTIPPQVPVEPAVRSRDEAHERAEAARRRAFGFRAQAEALRHHADLLVAVWDPDAEGKAGGTSESVKAALEEHLPVVAVQLVGPDVAAIRVLQTPADLRNPPRTMWREDLRECVKQLLRFPEATPAHAAEHGAPYSSYHPRAVFRAFLDGAPLPAPWPARCWPPLKAWMDRKRSFGSALMGIVGLGGGPAKETAPDAAPKPASAPLLVAAAATYDKVRRRASDVSQAFGNAHRGGMLAAYVLGALAVLLAFGGLLPHEPGWTLISGLIGALELGALLVLCALWRTSTVEDWHEAYTDTRLLAEALRCMEHLVALGVHVPLPKPPPRGPMGLDAGNPVPNDPRHMWSLWYFRALVREAPLRLPVIPRVPLEQQRDRLVTEWIGDSGAGAPHPSSQAAYHQRTQAAFERLTHGIERVTFLAFVTVFGASLFHLLVLMLHGPEFFSTLTVLVCLGFPALLAALSGFLAQIEAVRIHQRSQGMVAVLAERARSLRRLDLSEPDSADARWLLAVEAAATAELMVEETVGWALLYKNADIRAG